MRLLLVTTVLLMAGCSTPGVEVWGGTTSKQQARGFSFTVNHTRARAEAYRTNFTLRPQRATVFEAAALAIEQASGCTVPRSSLKGDVALVTAELIC